MKRDPETKNCENGCFNFLELKVWFQKSPELQKLPPHRNLQYSKFLPGVSHTLRNPSFRTCGCHFRQGKCRVQVEVQQEGENRECAGRLLRPRAFFPELGSSYLPSVQVFPLRNTLCLAQLRCLRCLEGQLKSAQREQAGCSGKEDLLETGPAALFKNFPQQGVSPGTCQLLEDFLYSVLPSSLICSCLWR